MKIGFESMEEKVLPNFKGGEKEYRVFMFDDENNKIMKGKLIPGASIGYHKHEGTSEIIFIISGKGRVLYDDTEEKVSAGECHYCPEGHSHSLINDSDEDLIFFAAVPVHRVGK